MLSKLLGFLISTLYKPALKGRCPPGGPVASSFSNDPSGLCPVQTLDTHSFQTFCLSCTSPPDLTSDLLWQRNFCPCISLLSLSSVWIYLQPSRSLFFVIITLIQEYCVKISREHRVWPAVLIAILRRDKVRAMGLYKGKIINVVCVFIYIFFSQHGACKVRFGGWKEAIWEGRGLWGTED